MTLRKRWRVVWAAITQDWTAEKCTSCQRCYWTEASVPRPTNVMCPDCETRNFGAWLNKMASRYDKEIA